MRPMHLFLSLPVLLLGACGDEGQQAQRKPTDSEMRDGGGGQEATAGQRQNGAESRTSASSATATLRPGQPTNRPPQPPALPETGPERTGSVIPPATPSQGQPAAPAQQPAAPDRLAPSVAGRTFTSGPFWIQFSTDNRFTLRDNATERVVRGVYALEGDRITFTEPQGEAAGLSFPFTCRMESQPPQSFTLGGEGSCATLGGKSFESQG